MAEPGESLTDREQSVLEKMADGLTNREIAQDLDISPNTVKVHVRNIFTKLEVSSRTEATTAAIQKGLLTVPGTTPQPVPDQAGADLVVTEAAGQQAEGEQLPVNAVTEEAGRSSVDRPSRFFIFVVVLAVGLFFGALVTAWYLSNEEQPTPTSQIEPFEVEILGDSLWRTGRPLPTERADMAVASIGLDLYVIGGLVDAGVVNLVDVYETDSFQWTSAATKPTAVSGASAAVLFGEIFVPGGRLADDRPTAVVEAYSPSNDAWRPVAALPVPIAGGLALSDGSNLYLLGGWDGEKYLDSAYVYDQAADAWQALPPMAHARADTAGDVIGDRLYVVGGFDGTRELADCEYFDVAENRWENCASMISPRAGAGASAQGNNLLYVIGGGKEGLVTGGEMYNPEKDSWSALEMPMIGNNVSWYDLGVVAVETHIYTLGGRQGQSILTNNYTFVPFLNRTYLPSVGNEP